MAEDLAAEEDMVLSDLDLDLDAHVAVRVTPAHTQKMEGGAAKERLVHFEAQTEALLQVADDTYAPLLV